VEYPQYILVMPAVVFLTLELRKWAEWLYNKKAVVRVFVGFLSTKTIHEHVERREGASVLLREG